MIRQAHRAGRLQRPDLRPAFFSKAGRVRLSDPPLPEPLLTEPIPTGPARKPLKPSRQELKIQARERYFKTYLDALLPNFPEMVGGENVHVWLRNRFELLKDGLLFKKGSDARRRFEERFHRGIYISDHLDLGLVGLKIGKKPKIPFPDHLLQTDFEPEGYRGGLGIDFDATLCNKSVMGMLFHFWLKSQNGFFGDYGVAGLAKAFTPGSSVMLGRLMANLGYDSNNYQTVNHLSVNIISGKKVKAMKDLYRGFFSQALMDPHFNEEPIMGRPGEFAPEPFLHEQGFMIMLEKLLEGFHVTVASGSYRGLIQHIFEHLPVYAEKYWSENSARAVRENKDLLRKITIIGAQPKIKTVQEKDKKGSHSIEVFTGNPELAPVGAGKFVQILYDMLRRGIPPSKVEAWSDDLGMDLPLALFGKIVATNAPDRHGPLHEELSALLGASFAKQRFDHRLQGDWGPREETALEKHHYAKVIGPQAKTFSVAHAKKAAKD